MQPMIQETPGDVFILLLIVSVLALALLAATGLVEWWQRKRRNGGRNE